MDTDEWVTYLNQQMKKRLLNVYKKTEYRFLLIGEAKKTKKKKKKKNKNKKRNNTEADGGACPKKSRTDDDGNE